MLDALLSPPALWFTLPALFGTAVFLLQLALMWVGVDGSELDGAGGADGADPGDSFQLLSFQSLAAFLMGFGWGGLGALNGAGWEVGVSIASGVGGGLLLVWLLAWLLRVMHALESSGNISIEQSLGSEGEVYATVPSRGDGRGQVRVVIDNRQRIYHAISDAEELPTSTRIRVVRVNPDRTLTVVPLA